MPRGFIMNVLRKVQSLLFAMCAVGGFQLFSMEIALPKKADLCEWKEVIFFVKAIQESRGMPEDISKALAQHIPALRKRDIYQKFDSFFHFDNDNCFQMGEVHDRNKKLFLAEYPQGYSLNLFDIVKFNRLYPYRIELCRKFDVIEPHDLSFFTTKQDEILSTLLSRACFVHNGGRSWISLFSKEYESYLLLCPKFREKLSKYSMNLLNGEHTPTANAIEELTAPEKLNLLS